jgi:hypothetical protein
MTVSGGRRCAFPPYACSGRRWATDAEASGAISL